MSQVLKITLLSLFTIIALTMILSLHNEKNSIQDITQNKQTNDLIAEPSPITKEPVQDKNTKDTNKTDKDESVLAKTDNQPINNPQTTQLIPNQHSHSKYLEMTGGNILGSLDILKNLDVRGNTKLDKTTTTDLEVLGKFKINKNTIKFDDLLSKSSSINDLNDINISSVAEKNILSWDSATNKFLNKDISHLLTTAGLVSYVIYIEGTTCKIVNTSTSQVIYSNSDHDVCIQYAIDTANVNGSLGFRAGEFNIDTPVKPKNNQTWWFNKGTEFIPIGDNRVIEIVTVDAFTINGSLYIYDKNSVSTTKEAIYIDDMSNSYFENIFIKNYFNGITLNASTGGINENDFINTYMQVRGRGMQFTNSVHDNHFLQLWIKGPSPTSWSSGPGLQVSTDGTQGGNIFDNVEILDMNQGIDLPGAFEIWFNNVIVDNAYAEGIVIGGSAERIFFGSVWTSSGGDGIVISGDSSSYADKISFNKIYTWLNGNYGIKFSGYVEDIQIGNLFTQRNAKGLTFLGSNNKNINIDSLISKENTDYGLDASGSSSNIYINNALIYDTVIGLDYLTGIKGSRVGTGQFESRGTIIIPNGTNTATVTHNLENQPTNILLTPYASEVVDAYISSKDSTSFTITLPSNVTANREIGWYAYSGIQLGDELLSNESFEEGDSSPDNWTLSGDSEWNDTNYRHGAKSAYINVAGSTGSFQSSIVSANSTTKYRLRGYLKGIGSTQTFLTVRWFSDAGGSSFISEDNIQLNSSYSDWTFVSSDITSPSNAQSADVMFRVPSSSTAAIYLDEVSLRKLN